MGEEEGVKLAACLETIKNELKHQEDQRSLCCSPAIKWSYFIFICYFCRGRYRSHESLGARGLTLISRRSSRSGCAERLSPGAFSVVLLLSGR